MRRQLGYIVVFVLTVMMMQCGRGGGAGEPLLVDSVVVDTSTVVGKNNGARYHLALNVKVLADSTYRALNIALIDSLLPPNVVDLYDTVGILPRQRVDQYIRSNFAAYKAFYGEVYDEEPRAGTASSDYTLTTAMDRNDDGIVNYTGEMRTVQNGQATTYTIALNIDLERRHILSLSDAAEDLSEKDLTERIVKELCKQAGCSGLEALQEQGYFTHTPPYPTENFLLGSDEITFIYIPGEIADREKGEIKVSVSR